MLEGWVLLATRSKVDAEQALSRFMEIATSSVSVEGVLIREVSSFSRVSLERGSVLTHDIIIHRMIMWVLLWAWPRVT